MELYATDETTLEKKHKFTLMTSFSSETLIIF